MKRNLNRSIFTIIDIEPRRYAPGDWVTGSIYGFHFQALVFFEHAKNPDWEIAKSRISKLELKDSSNERVVYSWDRGEDVAATDNCEVAVEFLSMHLADLVYLEESERNKVREMLSTSSTEVAVSPGGVMSMLRSLFIRLMGLVP